MTGKSHRGTAITAAVACGLLALTACGTTSETTGGGASSAGKSKCGGPSGKYTIGMSQANRGEPYRVRMDDDVQKAASSVPQFTVKMADAQKDNSKQVEQVESFITQKVDLIIISPNEATPLTAVVKKAYTQGIPVITLDRKVDGDQYTAAIGADNVEIGRQAGKYFAEKLLPQGGDILELKGLSGSTPAGERDKGFREGIQGSKINIVGEANADWERDIAVQKTDELLKTHPNVNYIYSENDPMAEGAYKAAQDAGKKDLKVTGIDGLPIPAGGIKAVQDGRLAATLIYPTGGKEGVEAAKKILVDCQTVPKTQTLQTMLVTKENAAEVYAKLNAG